MVLLAGVTVTRTAAPAGFKIGWRRLLGTHTGDGCQNRLIAIGHLRNKHVDLVSPAARCRRTEPWRLRRRWSVQLLRSTGAPDCHQLAGRHAGGRGAKPVA